MLQHGISSNLVMFYTVLASNCRRGVQEFHLLLSCAVYGEGDIRPAHQRRLQVEHEECAALCNHREPSKYQMQMETDQALRTRVARSVAEC